MLLGFDIACRVAVDKRACVARNKAADNGHALVSVFAVAGAVNIAVGSAVCNEAAIFQTDKSADLGEIAGFYYAGHVDFGCAVDNSALILHADDAADELIALIADVFYGAGNIAAVDNSAGEVAVCAIAVGVACYAGDIGAGLIACVECNVYTYVFDVCTAAEHAEQADIEVFLIECEGGLLASEAKAGNAVASSVEGAVKCVFAAADGVPCRAGYVDIGIQSDKLAGVVDLIVHGACKCAELLCLFDGIRIFRSAVAGGKNACVDVGRAPECRVKHDRTVAYRPVVESVVYSCRHCAEIAAAGYICCCNICCHNFNRCRSEVVMQDVCKCLRSHDVGLIRNSFGIIFAAFLSEGTAAGVIAAVGIGCRRKITCDAARFMNFNRCFQCHNAGAVEIIQNAVYLTEHTADICICVVLCGNSHVAQSIIVFKKRSYARPRDKAADSSSSHAGIRIYLNVCPTVCNCRTLIRKAGKATHDGHFIGSFYGDAAGCKAVIQNGRRSCLCIDFYKADKRACINGFVHFGHVYIHIGEPDIFDNDAVERVSEQAYILHCVVGNGHSGNGVSRAVERAREGFIGRRADRRPLAAQRDIGAELYVLALVAVTCCDLSLKVAQTGFARNDVRIVLSARSGREAGNGFPQRVIRRVDDAGRAFCSAALCVNAVGSVCRLYRIEQSNRLCPIFRCFFRSLGRYIAYNDGTVLLGKSDAYADISPEPLRRAGVRSRCVAVIHLIGKRRNGQEAKHHDRSQQQRHKLCSDLLCFHKTSFLIFVS